MFRHYIGTGNAFSHQSETLAVHYLDVGQGDAIVIQLPDGKVILMDSGTSWYYTRVKNYLQTRVLKGGNKKIDYLIATHAHNDHVGGLAQLLADFDVGTVYRPHNKSSSRLDTGDALAPYSDETDYADFITAAYTHVDRNNIHFIEAGIEIADNDNSYSLYFHTPTRTFAQSLSDKSYSDYNDISPIISLRYKTNLFIFTGDAGIKTENQFRDCARANAINYGDSEVYLKVGHHGSRYSTSVNLLEFAKPNKAIISVGAHNQSGHPHNLTLTRLKDVANLRGQDILETRILGNIALVTDGTTGKMFFAFDNEVDLSLIYIVAASTLFFVCFTNFHAVKC